MSQQPQWSADGQWWWNGHQWVPAAQAVTQGAPPPPQQPAAPSPAAAQAAAYVAPAMAYATSPQMIPKRSHTGRNLGIGCAIIVGGFVLLGIIGSLSNHGTSGPSTPAANDNNAAAAASSSPASTPSPASAPKVLLDKSGSGINKTASFTAAGDWEIDYSFDCSNFGSQGNFQVYVFNEDGSVADVPVNDLAAKGQDVSYEHQGGTYYLEMNSECAWHVVVKG